MQLEKLEASTIKQAIIEAYQSLLILLPIDPSLIPEKTQSILPFILPIRNSANMKGIVNILRKLYTFEKLLGFYFQQLSPLLDNLQVNLSTHYATFS